MLCQSFYTIANVEQFLWMREKKTAAAEMWFYRYKLKVPCSVRGSLKENGKKNEHIFKIGQRHIKYIEHVLKKRAYE